MNKELSYLTSLFGASGSESDVRQAILNEINPYCDQIRVDRLGNILAMKRGLVPVSLRLAICAPMDETALMVTNIDKDGFLRFDPVGDIKPYVLPGKRVVIGRHKHPGVIGTPPPHLQKDGEKLSGEDFFIDVGAKNEDDARTIVSEGDLIGFESEYQEFGERLVRAKALDNRSCCCALIELIKKDLPMDTYFIFSVLSEVGGYGTETAISQIDPQALLLLNGTEALFGENGDSGQGGALGAGPVLSCAAEQSLQDQKFVSLIKTAADAENVPVQMRGTAYTEKKSGFLARIKSACKTAVLSVPCRNLRTPVCTASLTDIEALERLMMAILKKIGLEAAEE